MTEQIKIHAFYNTVGIVHGKTFALYKTDDTEHCKHMHFTIRMAKNIIKNLHFIKRMAQDKIKHTH